MNLPRSTASPSAAGSSAPLLGKSGRKKCCNTLTEHRALITCSQAEINCQLLHHSTVPILRGSFCPSISATLQQLSLLFSASIVPILFHRSIWIVIRQLLNAVTFPKGRVADAYLKMDAQLVLPKHQERQSTQNCFDIKGQVPAMRLFWHHSRNKQCNIFAINILHIYKT